MQFSIFSTLAFALAASAKVIKVEVAQDGFSFTPSTVKAAVGDQVAFHFNGNGHNVAQGAFGDACKPFATNPFFSGTANGGQTWTITVSDTKPKAFYCVPHCRLGMVGVINPKGKKSYANFSKNAKAASGSTSPAKAQGGSFS